MTRTTGSDRERGQSAVIAVVLLIAVVAIGSIGILLVGLNANDQSKDEVQDERIRQSFVEMDRDIESVATSEAGARQVTLDLPDEADSAIRREDAGRIVVNRTNLTTTSTIVVRRIGAIVYERDGTHYAYQAGAVWRGEGNNTQMVSAPPIEYDTSTRGGDPTLTLPITDIQGSKTLNAGKLQVQKLQTVAPLNDVATIDNQLVTLTITSDYYVGWGNYFENRYENAVVNYDHAEETVTIKLGKREIDGSWAHGLFAGGDIEISNSGSDIINGTVVVGGSYTNTGGGTKCDADGDGSYDESGSACTTENADIDIGVLDNAIAAKARELSADCASKSDCEVLPSLEAAAGTLQGGKTYYVTGDSLLEGGTSVVADLSGGNVTILTEGDVGIAKGGSEIYAKNPDQSSNCCYLRIYFNGTDMAMGQKSGIYAEGKNSTRVQVYGTSDFHLDAKNIQNGGGWHAALYAPGESGQPLKNDASDLSGSLPSGCADYDICFGQGSGTVDGAVVAGSVQFDQSATFEYNPALATVSPVLGFAGVIPPPITFLHVAVNKVCVSEGDCQTGPTARVNAPATVYTEGSNTVTLDGRGTDYDGGSLTYQWSKVSGPGSLSNTNSEDATYNVPASVTSPPETVEVELTVTDDEGKTTTTTETFAVKKSDPPSASAGGPYVVAEGNSITLSGSGNDPDDGGSLSYSWAVTSGASYVSPDTASGRTPTLTTSTVSSDQTVTVELTVTDDEGQTTTDTTQIVVANDPSPWVTIDSAEKTSTGATWDATVEYTPDDEEGDLDTATVELLDSGGNVIDSKTVGVSGQEGVQQTTSFTGLTTEPADARVIVEDSNGNTGGDIAPVTGGAPTFTATSVTDTDHPKHAKYDVSYTVDDPAGGATFDRVEVTFEWGASSSRSRSSTAASDTINEQINHQADTAFTITVELYDTNGNVVECRKYTDVADGSDPGSHTSC